MSAQLNQNILDDDAWLDAARTRVADAMNDEDRRRIALMVAQAGAADIRVWDRFAHILVAAICALAALVVVSILIAEHHNGDRPLIDQQDVRK